MLRFVDPILDQARPGDIAALITNFVCPSEIDSQLPIIFQKLRKHVLGRHIPLVVVGNALKARDVPNRTQRGSSDLSYPLRNRIGRSEDRKSTRLNSSHT